MICSISLNLVTCMCIYEQDRRRVIKSGPAEEAIECRRHEKGKSTRGLRGLGGSPENLFLILSASMCVFNAFGTRF